MQYIFLDLEWNNAYSKIHHRFVNEIIEIGAVKLDENFLETDRFDVFIKSRITKKLGARFKNLTNISNEEMIDGVDFSEAIERFSEFCGKDFITITWSNSDLYAIAENFKLFLGGFPERFFEKYLDLQRFFQSIYKSNDGNQVSLKNAAESVGINLDSLSLHRASDDSAVTAEIFKRIKNKADFTDLLIDTSSPEFYKRLTFKPYLIDDLKSEFIRKKDLSFKCPNCHKHANPINEWTIKNKQFYNIMECKVCKLKFRARVRIKKCYDSTAVKKSIVVINNKSKESHKSKEKQPR